MCVIHQKNINCLKIYCKNEHKTGAEIKRYRGDKNWTVNDYSSVKKRKLDFEERKVEISYLNISTITNECPLYDVLHVHELLFNKIDEKSKWKNAENCRSKNKRSNRTNKTCIIWWFNWQSEGRHRVFDVG